MDKNGEIVYEVSCFSEKMYVGIGFGVDCDSSIISMPSLEAKSYCRKHFCEIQSVLDAYEINLFVKAMNSL